VDVASVVVVFGDQFLADVGTVHVFAKRPKKLGAFVLDRNLVLLPLPDGELITLHPMDRLVRGKKRGIVRDNGFSVRRDLERPEDRIAAKFNNAFLPNTYFKGKVFQFGLL
jgi:hypothetical protein